MPPRRLSPEAVRHARGAMAWFAIARKSAAENATEQEIADWVVEEVNKEEEKRGSEFRYDSVEQLYRRLSDWGIPDYLFRETPQEPSQETLSRKPRPPKPLKAEPEELPPAEGAYGLLRQGVEDLKENLISVRTLEEVRWGRVFETFGRYPGEGETRARGFWRHPHPSLVRLIVAYLLNNHTDQAIALLLQRLHPRHADLTARRRAKEKIAKALFGDPEKPPKHRGGLFHEIRAVASAVRGVPINEDGQFEGERIPGTPEGAILHYIVLEMAAMRQEGLTDKEVVRELREEGWGQYSGLGEDDLKALLEYKPEGKWSQ